MPNPRQRYRRILQSCRVYRNASRRNKVAALKVFDFDTMLQFFYNIVRDKLIRQGWPESTIQPYSKET